MSAHILGSLGQPDEDDALAQDRALEATRILLRSGTPNSTWRSLSIKPDPQYARVNGVLRPTGAYYNWVLGYVTTCGLPCAIQWCDSYSLSDQLNQGRFNPMGWLSYVQIEPECPLGHPSWQHLTTPASSQGPGTNTYHISGCGRSLLDSWEPQDLLALAALKSLRTPRRVVLSIGIISSGYSYMIASSDPLFGEGDEDTPPGELYAPLRHLRVVVDGRRPEGAFHTGNTFNISA